MGIFSRFSKKQKNKDTIVENKKENTNENEKLSQENVIANTEITPKEETNVVVQENCPKLNETNDPQIAEAKVVEAPAQSDEKTKLSFFQKLKRTRENLAFGISSLVVGKKINEDLYEEIETALLTADLGVETTQKIIKKLQDDSKIKELRDAFALKNNLKEDLKEILRPCQIPLDIEKRVEGLPFVILMVGVNGAGKTTTIGKLASKFKAQGKKVMLAAGDTFRAAAVEQLKEWGQRTNTQVISQPTGSDSASVIFDALNSAKAHHADVLICDTAGRLQNKDNLMEELKKIVRVMKKFDENVPNEILLVLDSTTGQNAVSQMKIFGQAVNVSGLCLTKLDGTAKGGIVFSLADQFKVPLRFVGIGEKTEDLRPFDVDSFVEALFD